MKKVTKQAYKKASNKATRIILATTLIASFSSVALAAEGHKRLRHSEARLSSSSNDISGVKFLLGAGVGTGLSAQSANGGFTILAPNAGLDAKLKLGTGIFTTTRSSTLGLQATIGVGVNSLGATSSFNPQYSVNLDFIQAFKVGSTGFVKLGYILGAGVTIRTHDGSNSGKGNFNSDSVAGAAVAKISGVDSNAIGSKVNYTLPDSVYTIYTQDTPSYSSAISFAKQAINDLNSGNYAGAKAAAANAKTNAASFATQVRNNFNISNSLSTASRDGNSSNLPIDLSDTVDAVYNYVNAKVDDKTAALTTQVNTLTSQVSTLTTEKQAAEQKATNLQNQLTTLQATSGQPTADQLKALQDAQAKVNELTTQLSTTTSTLTTAQNDLQNTQTQLDAVTKQLNDIKRNNQIAAANQANQEARLREASAKNVPSLLPTLKAGLVAFFGKHQAVSLEYQYYFRNTVQGIASSDISLNYTYYFGGK
ncbi:hypothetical protein BKH43_01960 [Helicobacter sp. 13S00401-1]|uniref:hypothetical protein n=1 Tax=Helicobacter sp. 13S00401-1 TaxID=1905758 RepID=UPI000BA76BC3|nr:hypothetical protein [Helicobacter sp. 13S00401-1]PAF51428.1 hypothetical protein BKH43_01960 [Helicobacter sp. 13S00401-1]